MWLTSKWPWAVPVGTTQGHLPVNSCIHEAEVKPYFSPPTISFRVAEGRIAADAFSSEGL
ncbi:hypothetical protein GCM10007359_07700 [Rothia aerolata]|uniref:Uncharacterized protein n=1 Tax=Rothia aerolata TaxID=1812262 RepID=A0A917IR13_9MICC|nr:hypothetical protein GCM10007359_07700 [Rothia aerolata]